MNDFEWSNILSVGVDEIDEDHRKLIGIFNILGRALAQGESRAYLEVTLEELINCTFWHFSHEERLMLKYRYEDFEAHKTEHRELIEGAKDLQKEILQSHARFEERHLQFLERWLTEHILAADGRLGDFLSKVM